MKRLVLVTSLLLISASTAWSQNYAVKPAASDGILFVSPNGSDSNDGLSWGSAKLRLHNASNTGALDVCPASGDCTIHISAGGITISTAVTISRSETTVVCEPGAVITLSTANAIVISSASDIVIQGVTLRGPDPTLTWRKPCRACAS